MAKKSRIDIELEKLDEKIEKYEKEFIDCETYMRLHSNETDTNAYKQVSAMLESYQRLISTCYEARANLINGEQASKSNLKSAVLGEAARGVTRGAFDLMFIGIGQRISNSGGLPIFGSEQELTKDFFRRK